MVFFVFRICNFEMIAAAVLLSSHRKNKGHRIFSCNKMCLQPVSELPRNENYFAASQVCMKTLFWNQSQRALKHHCRLSQLQREDTFYAEEWEQRAKNPFSFENMSLMNGARLIYLSPGIKLKIWTYEYYGILKVTPTSFGTQNSPVKPS